MLREKYRIKKINKLIEQISKRKKNRGNKSKNIPKVSDTKEKWLFDGNLKAKKGNNSE